MSYAQYIKEIGRGADGARDLPRDDAQQLYAAMLDGGVPDLEMGAIILGLPQVVSALDFEGSHGMLASIGIWFVGGMLVGMISPGRTFLEPFIASFIIAIPTVLYLFKSQTVFTLPPFLYVVMGGIGVLFALIGSYLGERIQLGPPPKPAE